MRCSAPPKRTVQRRALERLLSNRSFGTPDLACPKDFHPGVATNVCSLYDVETPFPGCSSLWLHQSLLVVKDEFDVVCRGSSRVARGSLSYRVAIRSCAARTR